MQHEREMRSDIDYLIDILRSNPQKKFTVAKLHTLTGLQTSFLKTWVDVLAEQGHIRFFYNLSEEEFIWDSKTQIAQTQAHTQIEKSQPKTKLSTLKDYEKEGLPSLLEDMDLIIEQTKKLNSRIALLKKSKNIDLAAISIAEHKLEERRRELNHLISHAKKFRK